MFRYKQNTPEMHNKEMHAKQKSTTHAMTHLIIKRFALGQEHVTLVLVAHHRELSEEPAQLVADGNALVF
jgi:hypothetical protein